MLSLAGYSRKPLAHLCALKEAADCQAKEMKYGKMTKATRKKQTSRAMWMQHAGSHATRLVLWVALLVRSAHTLRLGLDKVRNVPGGCPLQVRWIEDSHLADHGRDMLCSLNFLSSDWGLNKPREGVSVPASRGTTLCRDWICSLALLGSWVLHPFPQISLLNSDHPTIEQWIVTSIQVENLQQLIFGKNLEGLGPRFFLE